MLDRRSSGLSEFTWYSRLAAWIGAALLLAESLLGHQLGVLTFVSVLLLGFGFLCFLIGLAVDSKIPGTGLLLGAHAVTRHAADVTSQVTGVTEPAAEPLEAASSQPVMPRVEARPKAGAESMPVPVGATKASGRKPKFRERSAKAGPGGKPESIPPEVAPTVDLPEPAPHEVRAGVETTVLTPADVSVGAECPRCASSLRVGQLSAACPVCGRTHHAICWMENHFHCAAPDCTGHGSLQAPIEDSPQPDESHG